MVLSRRQRRMQQIHAKMELRRQEAFDAKHRLHRLQEEYTATLGSLRDAGAEVIRLTNTVESLRKTLSHPLHRCADACVRAVRVLTSQLRAIRG